MLSNEKSKMLAGDLYNAADQELATERMRARKLCWELNRLAPDDLESHRIVLSSLFGKPITATITPPFHCDYGYNIDISEDAYFNFNCVILDVMKVVIGKNTLFGPGVHIYTATHPLSVIERRSGKEFGKSVTIEDDVWIGGAAVICPGVTVGTGSIIGAGSVVTKNIPPGVVAVGNPCKIIKSI